MTFIWQFLALKYGYIDHEGTVLWSSNVYKSVDKRHLFQFWNFFLPFFLNLTFNSQSASDIYPSKLPESAWQVTVNIHDIIYKIMIENLYLTFHSLLPRTRVLILLPLSMDISARHSHGKMCDSSAMFFVIYSQAYWRTMNDQRWPQKGQCMAGSHDIFSLRTEENIWFIKNIIEIHISWLKFF